MIHCQDSVLTYCCSYFNVLKELRFSVRPEVCLLAVVFCHQDFLVWSG